MHTPRQTPPRYDYAVRIEGPLLGAIQEAGRAPVAPGRPGRIAAALARQRAPAPVIAARRAASAPRWWCATTCAIAPTSRMPTSLRSARRARRSSSPTPISFPGTRFRHALSPPRPGAACAWCCCCRAGSSTCCCITPRARCTASLLDAGVEIYEYHKSFLHAKVAVIDGHWATVGSSNIDPFSLMLAREANIVVEDRRFRRRAARLAARRDRAGRARGGEDALVPGSRCGCA